MKKLSIFVYVFFLVFIAIKAQVVNINPDPNGTPWITGGVPRVTPEIENVIQQIPNMNLLSTITPPSYIDNSANIYMRTIFEQSRGSCAQASGIGYVFTYEINWLRNLPADTSLYEENWYPTHFTYNYLNKGLGSEGSYIWDGWEIVKEMGCPNVPTYGGMHINKDTTYWMSGYDKYKQAMGNRVSYYEIIDFGEDSEEALILLKQWLFNHNNDTATFGGLSSFTTNMQACTYDYININEWILIDWSNPSGDNHQLTIVGYNDTICYDFNNDGQYTDTIDINNDSIVDMRDWEHGVLKIANSWGSVGYGKGGYAYWPYRFLPHYVVDTSTSPWDTIYAMDGQATYVVYVEDYEPEVTLRAKIKQKPRNVLRFEVGYGNDANAEPPPIDSTEQYFALTFKSDTNPMRGKDNHDPIELELDYNYFFSDEDYGKLFLDIWNGRIDSSYNSRLSTFSLMDYRWEETFEFMSDYSYIPFNVGANWFSIEYDLIPFVIDSNLQLYSNMVSRFEPTVSDSSTLTIQSDVIIDFYNSNLIINEGSTLIIEDKAILNGARGESRIDIYGNIQFGDSVLFTAEQGCELILNFINENETYSISGLLFDNAKIQSICSDLTISGCSFDESRVEKSKGSLHVTDQCSFINSVVYAFSGNQDSIVEISGNTFDNESVYGSPIFIDGYTDFIIENNTIIHEANDGISLYNSGGTEGNNEFIIENNEIYCSSKKSEAKEYGIKVYNSKAHIMNSNYIHSNDYGIVCLDYSQTKIHGYDQYGCDSIKQRIINNTECQVYLSRACFPAEFWYNDIYEGTFSTYLITFSSEVYPSTPYDVENNYWGQGVSNPSPYLYPSSSFDWDPICTKNKEVKFSNAKQIYDSAVIQIAAGQYQDAEDKFKEVIGGYPEDHYSIMSVNQLFELKKIFNQDFSGLQSYLDTTQVFQDTTDLAKLSDFVSNKCDIKLENYQEAINWYEAIIEDPETLEDSLFAIIDLGYLYLLMGDSTLKSGFSCKYPQYVPKSRSKYEHYRDKLLDLLTTSNNVSEIIESEFDNHKDRFTINSVFPNPFNGSFTISFTTLTDISLELQVFDISGRSVRLLNRNQFLTGDHKIDMDCSELPDGVYNCIFLIDNKRIESVKVVKLR